MPDPDEPQDADEERALPRPEEMYAPMELDVEQLFDAEAELRKAAVNVAVRDHTANRKELRAAALYYAKVVSFFEGGE